MQRKHKLDRTRYETDAEFHNAVDIAASMLHTSEQQLEFMLGLMRECRGCGAEPTRKLLVLRTRTLHCTACQHVVPVTDQDRTSFGRLVTLWNDSTLMIEGAAND